MPSSVADECTNCLRTVYLPMIPTPANIRKYSSHIPFGSGVYTDADQRYLEIGQIWCEVPVTVQLAVTVNSSKHINSITCAVTSWVIYPIAAPDGVAGQHNSINLRRVLSDPLRRGFTYWNKQVFSRFPGSFFD
jgi:hypothetical protein